MNKTKDEYNDNSATSSLLCLVKNISQIQDKQALKLLVTLRSPGHIKFIVDMRADMKATTKKSPEKKKGPSIKVTKYCMEHKEEGLGFSVVNWHRNKNRVCVFKGVR